MSSSGAIQNRRELAARMLEAALELDRSKVMFDGRRLEDHDIWRVASKIVRDIRQNTDPSLRVNHQTRYRFHPYDDEDVPGLNVAQMACESGVGKVSGGEEDMLEAAQRAVETATGTAGAIQVFWECWIREQGQWAAAAWETLAYDQREAVRACIDACEITAAIETFQAITNCVLANDKIVDHVIAYLAETNVLNKWLPINVPPPGTQTVLLHPVKTRVRRKR